MGTSTSFPQDHVPRKRCQPNRQQTLPQAQRDTGVRAIESYLIRREICGWTSKDYIRLFLQVLVQASAADPATAGDVVEAVLAGQTADSRIWPSDGDFMSALVQRPLYDRLSAGRIRAFLVALENSLRTEKAEPAPLLSRGDSRLNIEHLIPKKWVTYWPIDPDNLAAIDRRNSKLHMLGNLTLLTSKLNSSLQNNPWNLKRPDIQKHSLLRLTTGSVLAPPPGVANVSTDWTEERVDLRTLYLTGLALKRWKRPGEDED